MISEFFKALEDHEKILIISHQNPDGDNIGASVALSNFLTLKNKISSIVNYNTVPHHYKFVPGTENIKQELPSNFAEYTMVIVVDSSNVERTGFVQELDLANKTVVDIDHHRDNTAFGNINILRPELSSTSENIYWIFKEGDVDISYESAFALYVGILTDTGSFRFSCTKPSTFEACAELASKGLDISEIYKTIYLSNTFEKIKAEGLVLSSAEILFGNKCCFAAINLDELEQIGADKGDLEGVASYISSIKGLEVAALGKTSGGTTRFSLRSVNNVDVGSIAQKFGGGGHRAAAGCTIEKPFAQAKEELLKEIEKQL